MVSELERRTRELFEDDVATHRDYVEHWIASGFTLSKLAAEISAVTGHEIMRESIARYVSDTFGQDTRERMTDARTRGAFALVDDSIAVADEKVLTTEDNGRNRNRIAARQWLAERWNRNELGQPKQGAMVAISVSGLHLDALRVRVIEAPAATECATVLAIEGGEDDGQDDV